MAPAGPERPREARERLIVALDYPSGGEALALVDRLGEEVIWYKVGMELFYAEGAPLVHALTARGKRLFLDLKLHDIPNTMSSALRSLSRLKVGLTTVHVPAGREALLAVAAVARSLPPGEAPGLLGVTRLTSLPAPDPERPWDDVVSLAGLAAACGLYGWIAPAPAARPLRAAHGAGPALICPGIRLPENDRADQVAVGTPEDAREGGADWIVVGRPITQAVDPTAAARDVIRRLA
ncbi:MAG: orotidine-5'-phosphate decarboxylase [Candidatus Eisenbacteria bacterium]|nr:orotidine-5'-phosphate decarboxylase [Candidatus Eisenbacteria bacterium]MCC7143047.1 orotidine-5'-phosphate decarboxylase [Candidatus Eisenbacteria bacterium]